MSDPVILATGHTYDRSSIERWLDQGHKTCPVTGMRLRHLELTPNFALRSAIQDWAQQNGVRLAEAPALPQPQPAFKWEEARGGNILHGHEEIIWAIEHSEGRLFTASADKTVRVWDLETRRCVQVGAAAAERRAGGRAGDATHLAEGGWVVGGWRRQAACVQRAWQLFVHRTRPVPLLTPNRLPAHLAACLCLQVLEDHTRPVLSLAIANNRLFSGSYDFTSACQRRGAGWWGWCAGWWG